MRSGARGRRGRCRARTTGRGCRRLIARLHRPGRVRSRLSVCRWRLRRRGRRRRSPDLCSVRASVACRVRRPTLHADRLRDIPADRRPSRVRNPGGCVTRGTGRSPRGQLDGGTRANEYDRCKTGRHQRCRPSHRQGGQREPAHRSRRLFRESGDALVIEPVHGRSCDRRRSRGSGNRIRGAVGRMGTGPGRGRAHELLGIPASPEVVGFERRPVIPRGILRCSPAIRPRRRARWPSQRLDPVIGNPLRARQPDELPVLVPRTAVMCRPCQGGFLPPEQLSYP